MINISENLKKNYWRRRMVEDKITKMPTMSQYYYTPTEQFGVNYQYLTQDDFLNEIEPSAHEINSQYMSTRPIKEPRPALDKDGKPILVNGKPKMEWIITGYDDIETTRYGLQKRIAISKAAHTAGAGFSINNEQIDKTIKAHRRFDNLNSWKDIIGLDMAFREVVLSCFQTGDAGLYLYATKDRSIEYKVFSFSDGYQIFPQTDDYGNKRYFVLYSVNGKNMVDIYSNGSIETWINADLTEKNENNEQWINKIKKWFKGNKHEKSEDGWTLLERKDGQIGDLKNQFVYFRITDIPSGIAQQDIEALERSASYVAEEVKATAFDTLFIKATNIESLPALGSHGKVLAVKGDVDSLKASDAKRLAPSDISNIATIDLKEKKDSIMHSTLSVIVEPELLRSGADSSSAMRLCFNDEEKWVLATQPQFFKPLKLVVEVLKALVAKVERDGEYTKIRTSISLNIWVPQNFSENVENVTKMVYAGILSRENARHELDINYPDDLEMTNKESIDKLYRENYVPIQAKAEAEKKYGLVTEERKPQEGEERAPKVDTGEPGITNQATNK